VVELKDALWKAITDDANRIEEIPITHRPLDGHHRVSEEDNFIFAPEPIAEEEEDLPDAGGHMIDDIEFDGGEDYIESDLDEDYDDYTDFDDDEDDPQSYESLDDLYEAGPDGQPRLKK
jgi:hypothetical protein